MVEMYQLVIGGIVVAIGLVVFSIYMGNLQDIKESIKLSECEKLGMEGYINNGQSSPRGEFCTKDNGLYPVHFECEKEDGRYNCDMFIIGGWDKCIS